MTLCYFDCFAGAAGDMIVAALLDAGADFDVLKSQLAALPVGGFEVRLERVNRGGLSAAHFIVDAGEHGHEHRGLSDILGIIAAADLPGRVKDRSSDVFRRLAAAEAKVHGIGVEQVHFHEVGAIDSIVDIVAGCACLEMLAVDEIHCSAIPTGSGTVRCDHGVLPVPAPAVAELLRNVPLASTEIAGEATTPTAAAMLTALAGRFGAIPAMEISAVGYGAGTREGEKLPNVLRVMIGKASESGAADAVVELSANIDDCTGELLGAAIEKLLAAGCVDAWAAPIIMKKSRPAWMLSALCSAAAADAIERMIFAETTTFGVRRRLCDRSKLTRRHETIETAYGPIRIKIGALAGQDITASPEFADCLAAAEAHHVPVKAVISAAQTAYAREQI